MYLPIETIKMTQDKALKLIKTALTNNVKMQIKKMKLIRSRGILIQNIQAIYLAINRIITQRLTTHNRLMVWKTLLYQLHLLTLTLQILLMLSMVKVLEKKAQLIQDLKPSSFHKSKA